MLLEFFLEYTDLEAEEPECVGVQYFEMWIKPRHEGDWTVAALPSHTDVLCHGCQKAQKCHNSFKCITGFPNF